MSSVVNKETICNICGKEFDFPYLLERHKQNKKTCRIKSTEFECLHCCLCYANKYTLKKHMNKCKENKNAKEDNEDRNTKDINTNLMKALFINFIEQLKGCNASNDLLDNLKNLMPNTNIDSHNTTNNNTTQNTINNNTDSHNITNNDNSINNTINNNTNINIEKLVIYPFGYENIDSLPDAECLRMLKTTKNIIPILEKIYSLPHNHNFIRNNANKDVITVLESDLEIKTYQTRDFYRKLADGTINFLECLFHKYQPRMIFKHQLAILLNIEDLRNIYLDKQDFKIYHHI